MERSQRGNEAVRKRLIFPRNSPDSASDGASYARRRSRAVGKPSFVESRDTAST